MTRHARVRRTPEEARRVILDAALRLLARKGPDAIGLKDVAREAGVSHALVTHYFGTYDALVEAAFAEHAQRTRADTIGRIADIAGGGPRAWIEHVAKQLEDPLYGRLAVWSLLSGRVDQPDFFPRRDQGFRKVADAIEMRQSYEKDTSLSRDDIEFFMLLVLSSLMGYTLGKKALWAGMGREATPERDAWFRERLTRLLPTKKTKRRA